MTEVSLKEKSLVAYRSGIKRVIVPQDNEKDLVEIPDEVRKNVKFLPVKTIDEVFKIAFPGLSEKSLPKISKTRATKKRKAVSRT